jgi:NAD(P)-dependent dehydrogenase (short-subunit alcohol dehydrogenase family)
MLQGSNHRHDPHGASQLARSNTGDDVANIAAFLASEEARNITGQSLNVDGGLMWD